MISNINSADVFTTTVYDFESISRTQFVTVNVIIKFVSVLNYAFGFEITELAELSIAKAASYVR
jgi:hypothetical protein